jgi:uncharacterized membrane protein YcfT
MWFIQLLPILFVTARLTRSLPKVLVLWAAALMHIMAARYPDGGVYAMGSSMTGWIALDSYFLYLVYFLAGVLFAQQVKRFAAWVAQRPAASIAALLAWGMVEELAVRRGIQQIPGPTLVLGLAGAIAVVAIAALLAKARAAEWLALCGRRSLVVYLSFFLPMVVARVALLRSGLVSDVGWISLLVAACAVAGPVLMERLVRNTPLAFLYVRPAWARLRVDPHEPAALPQSVLAISSAGQAST